VTISAGAPSQKRELGPPDKESSGADIATGATLLEWTSKDAASWLEDIVHLPQYHHIFADNVESGKDIFRLSLELGVASGEANPSGVGYLANWGITSALHLRKIASHVRKLGSEAYIFICNSRPRDVELWTSQHVLGWLLSLGVKHGFGADYIDGVMELFNVSLTGQVLLSQRDMGEVDMLEGSLPVMALGLDPECEKIVWTELDAALGESAPKGDVLGDSVVTEPHDFTPVKVNEGRRESGNQAPGKQMDSANKTWAAGDISPASERHIKRLSVTAVGVVDEDESLDSSPMVVPGSEFPETSGAPQNDRATSRVVRRLSVVAVGKVETDESLSESEAHPALLEGVNVTPFSRRQSNDGSTSLTTSGSVPIREDVNYNVDFATLKADSPGTNDENTDTSIFDGIKSRAYVTHYAGNAPPSFGVESPQRPRSSNGSPRRSKASRAAKAAKSLQSTRSSRTSDRRADDAPEVDAVPVQAMRLPSAELFDAAFSGQEVVALTQRQLYSLWRRAFRLPTSDGEELDARYSERECLASLQSRVERIGKAVLEVAEERYSEEGKEDIDAAVLDKQVLRNHLEVARQILVEQMVESGMKRKGQRLESLPPAAAAFAIFPRFFEKPDASEDGPKARPKKREDKEDDSLAGRPITRLEFEQGLRAFCRMKMPWPALNQLWRQVAFANAASSAANAGATILSFTQALSTGAVASGFAKNGDAGDEEPPGVELIAKAALRSRGLEHLAEGLLSPLPLPGSGSLSPQNTAGDSPSIAGVISMATCLVNAIERAGLTAGATFDEADTNGNGQLSLSELQSFLRYVSSSRTTTDPSNADGVSSVIARNPYGAQSLLETEPKDSDIAYLALCMSQYALRERPGSAEEGDEGYEGSSLGAVLSRGRFLQCLFALCAARRAALRHAIDSGVSNDKRYELKLVHRRTPAEKSSRPRTSRGGQTKQVAQPSQHVLPGRWIEDVLGNQERVLKVTFGVNILKLMEDVDRQPLASVLASGMTVLGAAGKVTSNTAEAVAAIWVGMESTCWAARRPTRVSQSKLMSRAQVLSLDERYRQNVLKQRKDLVQEYLSNLTALRRRRELQLRKVSAVAKTSKSKLSGVVRGTIRDILVDVTRVPSDHTQRARQLIESMDAEGDVDEELRLLAGFATQLESDLLDLQKAILEKCEEIQKTSSRGGSPRHRVNSPLAAT